jgi:sarcosine oxidase subunit alpha
VTNRSNRLAAAGEHRFKGSEIDRRRSFTFQIDGRYVTAHPGDTLLTAALASGVLAAGKHEGSPLALDERFAPAVLLRGQMHDRLKSLPMERTPAAEGLDLVTITRAEHRRYRQQLYSLRGLLPYRRQTLGLNFDEDVSFAGTWFDAGPGETRSADLVVIGGGLAGLGAALAAGRHGETVILVERRGWLGGDARFFGSVGDEDPPDDMVNRLATALASLSNVTILTRAEAFVLFEGNVRVSHVRLERGVPVNEVVTLSAPRIVLAAGSIERLPVFAGNRLPGVVSSVAAYHRADRYGVWIGQKALLSTATSVAYRVAVQAKDAGIAVERIADTRLNPQSRFVEYGKAYGIPLARGVLPREAMVAGRRGGLTVDLEHHEGEGVREPERFVVDQLVVAGGWQPDLALWHMAGGGSRWNAETHRLEAEGSLSGIALAGGVAGFRNATAAIESGRAAVARLFGRTEPAVEDPVIDPLHETPDAPTPLGPVATASEAGAYLDGGASLATRPAQRRAVARGWLRRRRENWGLADQARPLGVADVVAGVELGAIPPADAAIVAQERCVTPGDIADAGREQRVPRQVTGEAAEAPPAYLAGRFGPRTSVWVVEAVDGRSFEVGCTVHADADHVSPLEALGVVFAPPPAGRSGGLAVIGRSPVAEGERVVVKDISAAIAVTLVDPLRPVERPAVATAPAAPAGEQAAPIPAPAAPSSAEAALALLAGTAAAAAPPDGPPASAPAAVAVPPATNGQPGEAPAIATETPAPPAAAATPPLPDAVPADAALAPVPADAAPASVPADAAPAPNGHVVAPSTGSESTGDRTDTDRTEEATVVAAPPATPPASG